MTEFISEHYNLKEKGIELPDSQLFKPSIDLIQSTSLAAFHESPGSYVVKSIQKALKGGVSIVREFVSHHLAPSVVVEHDLVSGYSNKVVIVKDRSLFDDVYYVATTLFEGSTPVGFKDFQVKGSRGEVGAFGDEGNFAGMERSIILIDENYETIIPSSIRQQAGDDTFFVREEYRGRNIGKLLWFTSMMLAQQLGAEYYYVSHDNSSRYHPEGVSFYAQLLGLESNQIGYYFPLVKTED